MTYAIRFDFPGEDPCYAGLYEGAWGFAPSLRTAELFDSALTATDVLRHGYAIAFRDHTEIVKVSDGPDSLRELLPSW